MTGLTSALARSRAARARHRAERAYRRDELAVRRVIAAAPTRESAHELASLLAHR